MSVVFILHRYRDWVTNSY